MRCTCEEIAAGTEGLSPVCFAHLWLFQNLPERDVKALTEAAWRKQYQAGELVFLQGDQARIMFIIKAGRVKLAKAGTDGGEVLVDIRKAGDFLGETFLSDDAEYPLTAECMEESLLCGFTKARFERLVTDNPNIGLQIIRNMSDRISWLTSRAGSTSATHLEERLHAVVYSAPNRSTIPRDADHLVHAMPIRQYAPWRSAIPVHADQISAGSWNR